MTKIAWIGLDWGTSNLRAFAVDKAGEIVEEKTSDRGMGCLEPHQFEPTMMELIDSWLVDGKQCQRRRKNLPMGRRKSRPFFLARLGACGP
ncbi:2-dehydro-3-deoxygalactonokinase [Cognatishimia sp.]|uniref:2-dehydro-3-deoxygalactonokinase n=1 Tax=Cognatishimia sp. TaxID=2211648 RepID=UPI003512ECAD